MSDVATSGVAMSEIAVSPVGGPPLELVAAELTPESWAPFGWLPVLDDDPRDGAQTLTFEWNDAHVNLVRHHTADVVDTDGSMRCTRLSRHRTHTQTLLALDARCVVAVAPADARFDAPADLAAIRCFELPPGGAVVLHQGTWHWGPYATDAGVVNVFNLQGRRWPEDNDGRDLSDLGRVVIRR